MWPPTAVTRSPSTELPEFPPKEIQGNPRSSRNFRLRKFRLCSPLSGFYLCDLQLAARAARYGDRDDAAPAAPEQRPPGWPLLRQLVLPWLAVPPTQHV